CGWPRGRRGWSSLSPSRLFARGLGCGGMEDVEEEIFVELRELALESNGHQVVGEVHEDAEVASSMLGEGGLELGGHHGAVARGLEQVIESGGQRVALGVVEVKAPADAAAEGCQVGVLEALGEAMVTGED